MSLAQASTTAKPERATPARAPSRRPGDDDLWARLDEKLAERQALHALAKSQEPSPPKGWMRVLLRGIGFGRS